MTIKTRLIAILVLFTVLIMAILGINFATYNSMDSDAAFVNNSGKLRFNTYKMAYLAGYIVTHKDNSTLEKETLQATIVLFDGLLENLMMGKASEGLSPLDNEKAKSQLSSITQKWESTFKPVYQGLQQDADSTEFESIRGQIDSYVAEINTMVTGYSEVSKNKVSQAKQLGIVLFVISLILSVTAFVTLLFRVIKPIHTLTEEFKQISEGQGDLTRRLEAKGKDEIAALTKFFNKFVSNVREMIMVISESSITLKNSMEAISNTSYELSKATEMIAISVQGVSEGSVKQSDMVVNLNGMVNNMNEEVESVLENANHMLSESHESRDAATAGTARVHKEIQELADIVQLVKSTAGTVDTLKSYSNDISNIVDLIKAVSEQTNLLALNASIEAARAGEAGKGFTVVAQEIRKLADETSRSTQQITTIVNAIYNQTGEVKTHMDDMVITIEKQSSSMELLQSTLNDIATKANVAYNGAMSITQSNKMVRKGFDGIVSAADEMQQVVESNTRETQEVAAAVEEQTASFQEVTASLSAISELSQTLNTLVSKFKV